MQTNNLAWLSTVMGAVIVAALVGASLWLLPPYGVLAAGTGLVAFGYLLKKPVWCYLAAVVTLPWLTVQVAYIHCFDILVVLTVAGLTLQRKTLPKVSIRTSLDWWLLPLALWLVVKGVTSLDPSAGSVYAARFAAGFGFFYLTVYMLRSQLIKVTTLLKAIAWAIGLQIIWGNVQNWTGWGYLANAEWAQNPRNYFAFLGMGSSNAQQAFGSFWHFAMFGHFLSATAAFFFPLLVYVAPKQRRWLALFASLCWTIVITYSRGALSAFVLALGYFSFAFPRRNTRLLRGVQAGLIIIVFIGAYILLFSHYSTTLNPRDDIWGIHAYYFDHHPEYFWLGSGIRSLEQTVLNYIPRYIQHKDLHQFAPHSFYLMWIYHLGVLGLAFVLAGLTTILASTFKEAVSRIKSGFAVLPNPIHKSYKRMTSGSWSTAQSAWWCVNAGVHLAIVVVLFGGINDHIFAMDAYLFNWLLLLIALKYALPWQTYPQHWESAFKPLIN